MLVISGQLQIHTDAQTQTFQSRNRDSCHFRHIGAVPDEHVLTLFQSRNREACHFRHSMSQIHELRMVFQSRNREACHFRCQYRRRTDDEKAKFQSRNREACHFRLSRSRGSHIACVFQSRNRDACHFRRIPAARTAHAFFSSFNLAIEMLVISGLGEPCGQAACQSFNLAIEMLVISGEFAEAASLWKAHMFQSRNRDACHFRSASCWRSTSSMSVSISQSRCLSFQEGRDKVRATNRTSFNLAIEMLVISGPGGMSCILSEYGFNLAIEMLVISGRKRKVRRDAESIVSISQSRCLSFQGHRRMRHRRRIMHVSISQSRCLSFQVGGRVWHGTLLSRFNLAIEMLVISGSGCSGSYRGYSRFNLAIEMLVISGETGPFSATRCIACFNLAIEMLVISG